MPPVTDIEAIADSAKTHWVNRAPIGIRPFLQLSRLDRPVGYWLLALPGWIGLAFAGLSHGLIWMDLIWAALILIGAIAMRGAGCSYNDIVDQDLDAQVERTALRPLPAGTVTTKQAWKWTFAQVGIGFLVWLCLPLLAKGIALLALPLVAGYPFMKRITWFPQVWLGMTFNWAFLVAIAIKLDPYISSSGHSIFDYLSQNIPMGFYLGLVFWTIGYDTIYACQDIEDDAMIGIKSTARKFGKKVKLGIFVSYFFATLLILRDMSIVNVQLRFQPPFYDRLHFIEAPWTALRFHAILFVLPFSLHLLWQVLHFKITNTHNFIKLFKSNTIAALLLIATMLILYGLLPFLFEQADNGLLWPWETAPNRIDIPLTQL